MRTSDDTTKFLHRSAARLGYELQDNLSPEVRSDFRRKARALLLAEQNLEELLLQHCEGSLSLLKQRRALFIRARGFF